MASLGLGFFSVASGHSLGRGAPGSRSKQVVSKLNLVSLMDIFTILVFFLMVNSGDVEVLQPDEAIELPTSYSDTRPGEAPVIKVSAEGISLKGEVVLAFDARFGAFMYRPSQLARNDNQLIQPLYKSLKALADSLPQSADDKPLSITLMSDASVPYDALKKVLYTCAQADFRDVAMAVSQTARMNSSENNAQVSVALPDVLMGERS